MHKPDNTKLARKLMVFPIHGGEHTLGDAMSATEFRELIDILTDEMATFYLDMHKVLCDNA